MMGNSPTHRAGKAGEDLAARLLESKGYRIVARNWRAGRTGEIDIAAFDGRVLAIVEVKTARRAENGDPIAWITPAKTRQLARLAEAFIATAEHEFDAVRFDVVTVDLSTRPPIIAHSIDAFRPEPAE